MADPHAGLRARIRAQADADGEAGWLDFPVPDSLVPEGRLRVPRGAFERWAVSRSGGDHLTRPWTAMSPSGLKVAGDDRYHTDWMLGAGLPLDAMAYGAPYPWAEALVDAAHEARLAVERRLLDFACSVLLSGPMVTGRVHHPASPDDLAPDDGDGAPPVLVLRDAGPDHLEAALDALDRGGAVVVERGGQMAHLVTVLREDGRGPLVRMPDARALYPDGTTLAVDPFGGRLTLRDDGRPSSGRSALDAVTRPAPPVVAGGPVPDGDPGLWPLRYVDPVEDAVVRFAARGDEPVARGIPRGAAIAPYDLVPYEDPPAGEPDGFARRDLLTRRDRGAATAIVDLAWHGDGDALPELLIAVSTEVDEGRRRVGFRAPPRPWTKEAVREAVARAFDRAEADAEPDPAPGMPGR